MCVRLRGRVAAVLDEEHTLDVGGPNQQAALAVLDTQPGASELIDRLANVLSVDEIPANAVRSISTDMSN